MVELATQCFHPVFHPVDFLSSQSDKIEPTSCCWTTTRSCLQVMLFFYQAGVQFDFRQFIRRWNIQDKFRVVVLRVSRFELQHESQFWCCIRLWWCKKKAGMISARIQPVSRIWNSARTSVQAPNRIQSSGKISSASLFAGQFRGDSTLIQTHFVSVSKV